MFVWGRYTQIADMHKYGNNDDMASATHLLAAGVLFNKQETDKGQYVL